MSILISLVTPIFIASAIGYNKAKLNDDFNIHNWIEVINKKKSTTTPINYLVE